MKYIVLLALSGFTFFVRAQGPTSSSLGDARGDRAIFNSYKSKYGNWIDSVLNDLTDSTNWSRRSRSILSSKAIRDYVLANKGIPSVSFGSILGNINDQTNLRDSLRKKIIGVVKIGDTVYNKFYDGSLTVAFKDSVIGNTTPYFGYFINDNFPGSSLGSQWIATSGFTPTVSSGITITGVGNFYNRNIYTTQQSAGSNYKESVTFTLTTKPTVDSQCIFIGRYASWIGGSSYAIRTKRVDASNWTIELVTFDNSGQYTVAANTKFGWSVAMTDGAQYKLELRMESPAVYAKLSRLSSGLEVEHCALQYQFRLIIGTDPRLPNTGGYCLGGKGGTYAVSNFNTYFYDRIKTDYAIISNSVGQGYSSIQFENSWPYQLFKNTPFTYSLFSGQGDQTSNVLSRLAEIMTLKPCKVLIEIGINDAGDGISKATLKANLKTIIDSVKSYGGIPILILLEPISTPLSEAYTELRDSEGVALVDARILQLGAMDALNIHPTGIEGGALLANVIRGELPQYFTSIPGNLAIAPVSKIITGTANFNLDDNTDLYIVDATGGDVYLGMNLVKTSTIGRQIKVIRVDNTSNLAGVQMFGGLSTINGTTKIELRHRYHALNLICIDEDKWVATEEPNLDIHVNAQTGTSYTLRASDLGKTVTLSNASAISLIVDNNLPAGFWCNIVQLGAGQVTLIESSTTINNREGFTKTKGQFSALTLTYYTTNTYIAQGDME